MTKGKREGQNKSIRWQVGGSFFQRQGDISKMLSDTAWLTINFTRWRDILSLEGDPGHCSHKKNNGICCLFKYLKQLQYTVSINLIKTSSGCVNLDSCLSGSVCLIQGAFWLKPDNVGRM